MLPLTRARRSRLQFPEERDLGEFLRVQDVPVDTSRLLPFVTAADDASGVTMQSSRKSCPSVRISARSENPPPVCFSIDILLTAV